MRLRLQLCTITFASAALTACTAPRLVPAPEQAPDPLAGMEGEYAFSGYAEGVGFVGGSVSFEIGGATIRANGVTCNAPPRAARGRIGFSCGGMGVSLLRADGGLAERGYATLTVARQVQVPGAGYDCAAWYPYPDGSMGCSGRGMTTVTRRHSFGVPLGVWRVD